MMEKTLILKHISRMLCLLISYSKFTRTFYAFCLHEVSKSDILSIYSSDIDEKRDCLQVELFAYEQNEWI